MKRLEHQSNSTTLLRTLALSAWLALFCLENAFPTGEASYVAFSPMKGWFCLAYGGTSAVLCASREDYSGVLKVAEIFGEDIQRVVHAKPEFLLDTLPRVACMVLIGTYDRNPLIRKLVAAHKIDLAGLQGRHEMFITQMVADPFSGVKNALVIAGSDKRGTIYGMFDLSAQMGVSPWYWWADVPVPLRQAVYVEPGQHTMGEPAVKYRGIFINDEAPALSGWVHEKFGNFNHLFYEKVFELLLRLKGNYLWPAMWGNAFNADDTLNPVLADEYGIVMGTSHHEPMLRAQQEWKRFGKGEWNYEKNDSVLREFWRQGIRNMDHHESVLTIGMRGDGDLPMSDSSNISLLERIISDQRKIIGQVTGKNPSELPQDWALYKEVQDYFNKGMRVPNDITLLLCDDNWGNIRLLPRPEDKPRPGGYGIYYHFDYVGGPRNYKWINTNQLSRVWEQMHLAWSYGVDRIWIVNVGDIKPMELPISFFLDYAWSPDSWPEERMEQYSYLWAKQQFGEFFTRDIADILLAYPSYNSRRKPELLSPETYSLVNFHEASTVMKAYNRLVHLSDSIYQAVPAEYKAAFYQLVLFPVKASANLNQLYITTARNRLYARQGRAITNMLADRAAQLFARDSALCREYNTQLSGGKWNHMMDQTHIGYTYWQQPPFNMMPAVNRLHLNEAARPGLAVEGSESCWPQDSIPASLPELNPFGQPCSSIDLYNRGRSSYNYTITTSESWIHATPAQGSVGLGEDINISVDWDKVPRGRQLSAISISTDAGQKFIIAVPIFNPAHPRKGEDAGFVESAGYVSMEAEHFTYKKENSHMHWTCIHDFGRSLSGVTLFPVPFGELTPSDTAPHLEYSLYLFDTARLEVQVFVSPTQDFQPGRELKLAVAFDRDRPAVVKLHTDQSSAAWERSVSDNILITRSQFSLHQPGGHLLKLWLLDPGIVVQKIVIESGKHGYAYLGPPESYRTQGK